MNFPYVEFAGKFLPIIPIKFKAEEGWIEFKAYVDSGAGYSIFHSDVAELIGLKHMGSK